MIEIRRITPEEVLAAYKATGWKPTQGRFHGYTGDGCECGCAIGVISAANGFFPLDPRYIAEKLGYSSSYIRGFIQGFDELSLVLPLTCDILGELHAGHDDGKLTAKAVFKRSSP